MALSIAAFKLILFCPEAVEENKIVVKITKLTELTFLFIFKY